MFHANKVILTNEIVHTNGQSQQWNQPRQEKVCWNQWNQPRQRSIYTMDSTTPKSVETNAINQATQTQLIKSTTPTEAITPLKSTRQQI